MVPTMPPAPPPGAPSDASLSPLSLPATPPSRTPAARTPAAARCAPSAHLDDDAPPPSAADLAADLLALEATIQADVLLLATAPVAAGALPPIAAPTADASSPSGVPRAAFIESVLALHAIVTRKLYRAAGVSLEPYFRRHFRLSRAQVYRLLDCALLYLDFADRDAAHAMDPDRLAPYPLKQRVCKTIRALAPDAGWRQQLWARTLEQHAIAQGGARPATVPPTPTDPVLAALVAPAISHVDDLTSKHIKEVWDTMLTDDAVRAEVEAAVAARAVVSELESPAAADGTPIGDDAGSSTRSSGSRSAPFNRSAATAPTINPSPAGSTLAQRRRGRRNAAGTSSSSTHSAPPSVSSPPALTPWRATPHALQAAGDDDLLSTAIAVLQELAERGHLLQPYMRDGWEQMIVKWRFMRAPPAIARRTSMAAAPWPSPTDPPVSATFYAPVPHVHAPPSSQDMDVDAIPTQHDLAAGLAAFAPPPPPAGPTTHAPPMPWFTPVTAAAAAAHALAAATAVSPTATTASPAPQYAPPTTTTTTTVSTAAPSVPVSSSAASTAASSLSPWTVTESQFSAAGTDRPLARRARALASPLAYTAPPHVRARSAMLGTGSAPPPPPPGIATTAWHVDHHAAAVALMMAASSGTTHPPHPAATLPAVSRAQWTAPAADATWGAALAPPPPPPSMMAQERLHAGGNAGMAPADWAWWAATAAAAEHGTAPMQQQGVMGAASVSSMASHHSAM